MKNWSLNKHDNISVIIAINLVHITPWSACQNLFLNAKKHLSLENLLLFYGPYKINGLHTSESNINFNSFLQNQNPEWGVRNLEDMVTLGREFNFSLKDTIKMPANNLILIFEKK